jgi:hypothetical protein
MKSDPEWSWYSEKLRVLHPGPGYPAQWVLPDGKQEQFERKQ